MTRSLPLAWVPGSVLLLVTIPALAQEPQPRWSWPEKAENLQQLPKDFPPENLRAVMTGFTRALGVRCSYCHVGQEDQPLSTYDFVSDENPMKQTARTMLQMLGTVNEHLKTIEPSGQRVNMWCHTCHNGKPRPATLAEVLLEVYEVAGLEATVERFHQLRQEHYGTSAYDFSERSLNTLGYELLGDEHQDAAIAIFRLNTEYYPDSANVWDSLAEAYLETGEKELARIYYEKSLTLDPENRNALGKLKALKGEAPGPQP